MNSVTTSRSLVHVARSLRPSGVKPSLLIQNSQLPVTVLKTGKQDQSSTVQSSSRLFFPKVKNENSSKVEEFPCKIFFLSNSNDFILEISNSFIYTRYIACFPGQSVADKAPDTDTQRSIMHACDEASGRIQDIFRNFFTRNPILGSPILLPNSQSQNNLQKEIKERMHDLPESFLMLKPCGQRQVQTHPYLSKMVGVHKLATLSSGIYADHPKVLGYIGFLNILFLHDDIKVDSLAPSVYTQENKGLLSELHKKYMALYDEVLNSLEKTASWNKEESQVYKDLVIHSDLVDSKFGQAFFLGDAIVRFAQDVYALLSSSFTSPDSGRDAKINVSREVNRYFLACEEEFENKIKGDQTSFVKLTKEETIFSYLEIRRRNGAVAPCFEYVFLMHGLDINMDQMPLIDQWKELRISYIDHICIVNDLLSFPKELTETSPHNLILILKEFYQDLKTGFSESTQYLDQLTTDITNKKQEYFKNLSDLLINKVLCNPMDGIHQTLESLLEGIVSGHISINPDQKFLVDNISNAYQSILLMEQWANGHIAWEHDMRSKRHDIIS